MRLIRLIILFTLALLTSCHGTNRLERMSEDLVAKQLLQGIWVNDSTDMPFFLIQGDSIKFTDHDIISVSFKVIRDSIYLLGTDTISYKIERQADNLFWLRTNEENVMKLYRSESDDDRYAFEQRKAAPEVTIVQQKMQKDSVITYGGVRYRGYVFINPSRYKVTRKVFDDNGIARETVYYDNIIHICVYEGAHELYGRDIDKKLFAHYLEEEVLSRAVLADMDFMDVDDLGYHYRAALTVPDSSVSYYMDLTISPQGTLTISAE
ncbi:MAG: DUF4738 domain-containing protein [Bacteroidaceae bacterium]|nr:DUF4738 domain-containing protein [Bacteroidaceae bacterium]